ncbi:prepilin peptidase [Paenibacillus oenotherae]|uniref:Prepilin peptidase n=1 Tax=Paenibacillus oenotherae TaxID=1435645 RepID=A0ABS7D327_9BACL|nr:A24 family peptidase [Paenibacillus oenotherae]MBW7473841.1 prepilin peptidase [Paenibacillus oenotherae]
MFTMEIFLILMVGIFGLLIGSFLNVVAIRTLTGESVAFPSSHCMACHTALKPYELVPILSYVLLRGKCRSCKIQISPVYPIGELVTSMLFMLFAWKLGFQLELIPGLIFISIMVIIVQTDIKKRIIPDRVLLYGLIVIVLFRLFIFHPLPLWNYTLASLIVGVLLYTLAAVSKGGIGGGDIKLFALIALFMGMKATLLTLFAASLIGFLFGMLGRLQQERKHITAIPFGPYIALVGTFAYLWGEPLFDWYWGLFT